MRNVLFITPFPGNTMEYARAAASLEEVRMLGIAQEVPGGGDAEVFGRLRGPARGVGPGRVLRVTGVDRAQELVGRLLVEASLPWPGAPHSDGDIIVRRPDTKVITAAIKTISETIGIEYG